MLITKDYKKTKTGDVVVSHRACDNSKRFGQNLFLIGDNKVFVFQTIIVFRGSQKLYSAIENSFLAVELHF